MNNLTLGELKLICAEATVKGISDDIEIFMTFEEVEMYVNNDDFEKSIASDDMDYESDRLVKTKHHCAVLCGYDHFECPTENEMELQFKQITV